MEKEIDWEKIISLYNTIKELYALCEEIDPELNTNLQPLNEFRSSLDHLMRICAIEKLPQYNSHDSIQEAQKLYGHLKRAFFDICDLVSIYYRNKIIDILEEYSKDEIQTVFPEYYSKIRMRIEMVSSGIAGMRTKKRFEEHSGNVIDDYCKIIDELSEYYRKVLAAVPALNELQIERIKAEKRNKISLIVIPLISAAIALAGVILGIFF